MQIIYMHHAERDIGENHFDSILRQEEDITELGIKCADLIAERTRSKKFTAITPYAFEEKNEAIKTCHSSISELNSASREYTR